MYQYAYFLLNRISSNRWKFPVASRLPQCCLYKMVDNLLTPFPNEFLTVSYRISIKNPLTFLPKNLLNSQHCSMQWLGVAQARSHYLNQCRSGSPTHICIVKTQWVNSNGWQRYSPVSLQNKTRNVRVILVVILSWHYTIRTRKSIWSREI